MVVTSPRNNTSVNQTIGRDRSSAVAIVIAHTGQWVSELAHIVVKWKEKEGRERLICKLDKLIVADLVSMADGCPCLVQASRQY